MSYIDRIKESKMSWLGLAEDYAFSDRVDWIGMKGEESSISISVPIVLGIFFFLAMLILRHTT